MIISAMDARSWYDSLQVSWRRQYGKGLTAAVFYTLGKAIDEASPTNTTLEVSGGPMIRMDSDDLRLDKGLGVFDVRQNLSGSFLWKPPLGRGSVSVSVLNAFVRDWQIGGFLTLASGHPFTPLISFNNSRNGVSGASAQADRPNMRPGYEGNVVIGKVEKWYEPRAFELPQVGFFGNLVRNTIPGPGFYDFDLVVSRDSERVGGPCPKACISNSGRSFSTFSIIPILTFRAVLSVPRPQATSLPTRAASQPGCGAADSDQRESSAVANRAEGALVTGCDATQAGPSPGW